MHIKKITVKGFKSYRDKTEIELSNGHNIIVGENGSGKSNIFTAVEFVLSNRYSNLGGEERSQLIYEDSSCQSLMASVEILFDNSDKRFPVKGKQVTLARVLSSAKDEYFLDGKHTPKSHVESLLESAGMSRSNTYFIVRQGKVNGIIKMSERERLDLLKEIAGTRIYEDKRKESLGLLRESSSKSEQIQEILSRIEKRITELEGEKDELLECQKQREERDAIELAIYRKEWNKLKETYNSLTERSNGITKKIGAKETEMDQAEKALKNSRENGEELNRLAIEMKQRLNRNSAMKRRHSRRIEHIKGRIQFTENAVMRNTQRLSDLEKGFRSLKSKSKVEEEKRAKIEIQLEKIEVDKAHLDSLAELKKTRLEVLKSKNGQREAFSSKAERDCYLRGQIAIKRRQMESDRTTRNVLKEKLAHLHRKGGELKTKSLAEKTSRIEEELKKLTSEMEEKRQGRRNLIQRRKALWRELGDRKKERRETSARKLRAENDLRFSMSKNQYLSLTGIKRLVRESKIKGYRGIFGELFSLKHPKFANCVEKVAGNRLFFHITDDDEGAAEIIEGVSRLGLGRATIMPLSRLSSGKKGLDERNHPKDVIPMITQLNFDERYTAAMQQVFGKTLIARDLKVAAEYSLNKGVDAITLEGDQAFKKGSLSGGFYEKKRSRQSLLLELKEVERAAKTAKDSEELNNAQLKDVEANLAKTVETINEFEAQTMGLSTQLTDLKSEMKFSQLETNQIKQEISKMEKTEQLLQKSEEINQKTIDAFHKEIDLKFESKLTPAETEEIKRLFLAVRETDEKINSTAEMIFELKRELNKSESFSGFNINCRLKEIDEQILETKTKQRNAENAYSRLAVELDELKGLLREEESKRPELKEKLNGFKTKLKVHKEDEKIFQKEKEELKEVISSLKIGEDHLKNRKELYQTKIDELQEKIDEISNEGKSDHLTARFEKETVNELIIKLKAASKKVNTFSVNQKALDQHLTFCRQREDLEVRKKEQNKGQDAIKELIAHLDLKKDEVIANTFAAIAEHFGRSFAELVPGGKAELTISNDEKGPNIASYKGVGMKVSFGGNQSMEGRSLDALSGGQQTIAALALIFAIQRCDPAPFYFLDEVDANLDSAHRSTVAELLRRLNEKGTQVISTTFKPEPLSTAERCFQAVFSNKVSSLRRVSPEKALEVVTSKKDNK